MAKIHDIQKIGHNLGEDQNSSDAIVNLLEEHGLVTDHTSVVVLRVDQFEIRGVERKNRDRCAIEIQTAEQRANNAAASYQADAANRPSPMRVPHTAAALW